MADAFVPVTFVADELLTSTKLNQLSANQAAFHDGTGLGDGSMLPRHLSLNVLSNAASAIKKTVDANGWTIYDLGALKLYLKRGNGVRTVAASGWTSTVLDYLPVGFNTIGSGNFMVAAGSADDKAIRVQIEPQPAHSSIAASMHNVYNLSLTTTIWWSVCIITG